MNSRLDDGQDGPQLLDWLNSLPETRQILNTHFAAVPVSPQNLSEWRQGGFHEWEARQDFIHHAHELSASSKDTAETIEPSQLACDLAAELALRFAALLNQWDGEGALEFADKLHVLHGLARDISLIQKTIQQAAKFTAEYTQHLEDQDQRHKDELKKHALDQVLAARQRGTLVQLFGGGESGERIADYVTAIKYDLPLAKNDDPIAARQTKSNQIKPVSAQPPAPAERAPVSVDITSSA
ncbi:MAG: hypothetical protein ABSG59_06650 [Verrucomicrobiota bacterium]